MTLQDDLKLIIEPKIKTNFALEQNNIKTQTLLYPLAMSRHFQKLKALQNFAGTNYQQFLR